MEIVLKSKPVIISLALGLVMLMAVGTYLVLGLKSPKVSTQPKVVVEPGNPRAVSETGGASQVPQPQSDKPSTPVVVKITDTGFVPAEVKITKYSIVTFTNEGTLTHSVRGSSGKWGSFIDLEVGKAYSQQFDVAGVYEFFCPLHPEMKGKVVVVD